MKLSFEFLKNCKPCELLRVKIEDVAEFAILGAPVGQGYRALVVLKENEPPLAINLLESGSMQGDFDTYAALHYGKFQIIPEHIDRCEIGNGPLFTKAGSLILSGDSTFLVVRSKGNKNPRYFDLDKGDVRGEPSGNRAAFKAWSLWHDDLALPQTTMRLIRYSGKPASSEA